MKAKYNCYFASYNIFDLDVTTNHSFSNFTVALPATVHYWKKGKNQIGLASHYQFFSENIQFISKRRQHALMADSRLEVRGFDVFALYWRWPTTQRTSLLFFISFRHDLLILCQKGYMAPREIYCIIAQWLHGLIKWKLRSWVLDIRVMFQLIPTRYNRLKLPKSTLTHPFFQFYNSRLAYFCLKMAWFTK